MGSIVSLFTGIAPAPAAETPRVAAPAVPTAAEENQEAEERRRTLAQVVGGQTSTVQTTPLGSTARAEVARTGLNAADAAAGAAAAPRKTTLG